MDRKTSWLICNAAVPGSTEIVDISIRDGVIAEMSANLRKDQEATVLDVEGRLVIPGFVDAHMHLDKAYALDSGMEPADSLKSAIQSYLKWSGEVTPERMVQNARRAAEQVLAHGTIALRTHVSLNKGREWLEAHLRLREELAPWLAIQLVAFSETESIDQESTRQRVTQAIELGVDLIGGATVVAEDQPRAVDFLFDLAGTHGCGLDLHVDESDDPADSSLGYIAERKIALGFSEEVTVGHCCSLSALDEKRAAEVVQLVAEAGIHVITLPSCNLYLMGRQDRGLIRRGLTRVNDFLEAGVNTAFASDNVRDAFNPFGKNDMLQGAMICGHALQMGGQSSQRQILEMATSNPARILGLPNYGFAPGCEASLVVLDDTDWGSAIARVAPRRYVFSRGRLVSETTTNQALYLES